jgi:hypothetical protein
VGKGRSEDGDAGIQYSCCRLQAVQGSQACLRGHGKERGEGGREEGEREGQQ